MLPSRAHPLSYEDLAPALLGFVATAQHKDAPEAVRKFSAARCGAASADNQEVPLMGMSLLHAVTAALQPPFWIAGFTVNTTAGFSRLEVVNGWLTSDWDGTKSPFQAVWRSTGSKITLPSPYPRRFILWSCHGRSTAR